MQIIDDPLMLVLEERPWLLGSLLTMFWVASVWGLLSQWIEMSIGARLGLGFWVVALPLGISVFVQFVEVRFDRRKALVSVSQRGLFQPHDERYSLAHFRGARVQTSQSGDGPGYRLVLTFDEAMLDEMDPTTLQTS